MTNSPSVPCHAPFCRPRTNANRAEEEGGAGEAPGGHGQRFVAYPWVSRADPRPQCVPCTRPFQAQAQGQDLHARSLVGQVSVEEKWMRGRRGGSAQGFSYRKGEFRYAALSSSCKELQT